MNLLALLSLLLLATAPDSGWDLEQIRLLAMSPEEARAVLWIPEHGQVLLQEGDTFPGREDLELIAVLEDRLVVEEKLERGGEVTRARAWIERVAASASKVRVRRMSDRMEPEGIQPTPPRIVPLELPPELWEEMRARRSGEHR